MGYWTFWEKGMFLPFWEHIVDFDFWWTLKLLLLAQKYSSLGSSLQRPYEGRRFNNNLGIVVRSQVIRKKISSKFSLINTIWSQRRIIWIFYTKTYWLKLFGIYVIGPLPMTDDSAQAWNMVIQEPIVFRLFRHILRFFVLILFWLVLRILIILTWTFNLILFWLLLLILFLILIIEISDIVLIILSRPFYLILRWPIILVLTIKASLVWQSKILIIMLKILCIFI